MKIIIVQGDASKTYKFKRKDAEGNIITTLPKKMWITFKPNVYQDKALFQKNLDDGISYSNDDNYYRFSLDGKDTENLAYGEYGYDIKIINEAGEPKTLLNDGVLIIKSHYTHKNNEV